MSDTVLPKYVDYGGLTTVPSPFQSNGTTLYCFMLEADLEKLRAFCKQVFSDPSGGKVEYVPLTRFVMMTVGNIQSIVPQPAPFNQIGYSSEGQVAFWIFTAAVRRIGEVMIAERPAVFVPYIFVHNAFSSACGREVEGYPKSWGWFNFPDQANHMTPPPPLENFALEVWGLKKYDPKEIVKKTPMLQISCGDPLPNEETHTPWSSLEDVFNDIKELLFDTDHSGNIILPGLKMAENLLDDLRKHQLPEVFLKQYRDVADAQNACYQAIVEVPNAVKTFNGFLLPHKYNFTLEEVESHPIGEQLGLKSQESALSFWIKMDFTVENGRVVWQAPTSNDSPGCLSALLGKLLGR